MGKTNTVDLLFELIKTNFKLRYNNSVLGFVWVLLKPFLTFLVLYIVFSNFRGNSSIDNYTIYLLSGIILFTFINEGVLFGLNSLLDKANIILKVNFNKIIAVLSSEIMALVNFLINLLILSIFIIFNPVNISVLSFFYLLFILFVISLGLVSISLFSSILILKFRDLQNIAELAMQLLFYGSAIFYPVEQIPGRFQWLIKLNPLYNLIDAARNALVQGEIINTKEVLIIFFVIVFFFSIGAIFFSRNVKKVAEYF
ncbi:ABC transporter permease [Candidatus Dojkabacteria bacterium]|nr:ABC transporter permease [Candidatus Dojkabacteria bacterium]